MTRTPMGNERHNVELKSRLRDFVGARRLAQRLSGAAPEVLRQVDTYFRCTEGRLKLREITGGPAQLIAYARPNNTAVRTSRYYLVDLPAADSLREALTATLGVLVTVEKVREISLYKNVRIHLDRVTGLGDFLEFEAVMSTGDSVAAAEALVRDLSEQFGLAAEDLIGTSYSDLLLAARS